MKLSLPIVCLSAAALLGLASADKLPSAGFGNGFARQVEDDSLSGPYAPSGWQPDGPQLQLPTREYGAPVEQQPEAVEVSEENILFAGQSVTSEQLPEPTTTTTVSPRYLPPSGEDVGDDDGQEPNVLRVQGLPLAPASEFNGQLRQQVQPRFKQQQQLRFGQQQQQQKQIRFNQQFRVQQQQQQRIVFQPSAARIVATPSFVPTQPRLTLPAAQVSAPFRKHKKPHLVGQQQFGQLQQQQQQQQFAQQQQQQFAQQQQIYGAPPAEPQLVYGQPQTVYGPPAVTTETPAAQPELQTADNEDDSEEQEDNETDAEQVAEDVNGPAVSVANAFDTPNSGQYYILGEDNRLQRVVYMTSQTPNDRRQNGFTAKLQYAPVEPIRDPIYAYDAAGQLVRIYNRK